MALISCPKCGNSVSDKAVQCPRCGYRINNSGAGKGQVNKVKNTFAVFGILIGLAMVAVGVIISVQSRPAFSGHSTSSAKFGADFYTDEFEATKNASDNVMEVGRFINKAYDSSVTFLGIFVSLIGGAVVCYFGCKINDSKAVTVNSIPIPASNIPDKTMSEDLPEL